ncbi:MAG TPA: ABC transporter permease [Solirubrobacterales bacterium]|nr:ABC transporter permease [Solirubrobacterales bacterium]
MTNGAAALALPLAKVGEVGESFFHHRTSETLPCQATDKLFCFDWAKENIGSFGTPTMQHFELVAFSVVIGFAIAFSLALLAHRRRWLRPPLLAATGVLYTVPSIAFFFLLLPITGLGRDSVIVALSAYTLQIIYRNTLAGLANVPSSVRDAARGMGLTERQILWKVELPLATPEIVAGLRIATVSTVAIATLAVLASGGGLGVKIYSGGNLTFKTSIIVAGAIAILMALAFDLLLLGIQRLVTPWRRAEVG